MLKTFVTVFIQYNERLENKLTRAPLLGWAKSIYIVKNDCDQETGKEYSTTVQITVKDDRRKAIAWRSVSCKMTCYHLSDKTSINPQSAFCIWRSAFCTERISVDVFVRASLKSEPKYWSSKKILERPSWSLWVVCGGELLRKSTSIEQWLLKSNWRRTQMRGLPIWPHLMLFRLVTAWGWNEPTTGPLSVNISTSRLELHF